MRAYSITHDIFNGKTTIPQSLIYKQYDNEQSLRITLLDNQKAADMTGVSCIAFFKLPNGSIDQRPCTPEGNVINLSLNGNLLLHSGYVQLEIKMYKDSAVTTTFTISYTIESSINMIDAGGSGGLFGNTNKLAILVVAGQSNSVGYDESPLNPIFSGRENPRVKQLGLYGDDNLRIIPLTHFAQNLQDMKPNARPGMTGTKGIHLPLGNLIVKEIPDDYNLVILPVAYGGTGFTVGNSTTSYDAEAMRPHTLAAYRWGVNSVYYRMLKERLDYLLGLNPLNYYIGTVWCQGEHDNRNAAGHKTEFIRMTDDFFAHFNGKYPDRVKGGVWGKKQWFIHDTVPFWRTANPNHDHNGVIQIWNNYRDWSPETFVTLDFGQTPEIYTNQTNGTFGTSVKHTSVHLGSHFGNDAFYTLVAPAVYKKMLENNIF